MQAALPRHGAELAALMPHFACSTLHCFAQSEAAYPSLLSGRVCATLHAARQLSDCALQAPLYIIWLALEESAFGPRWADVAGAGSAGFDGGKAAHASFCRPQSLMHGANCGLFRGQVRAQTT